MSRAETVTLLAAERARSVIIRSLPAILFWGAFFTLLARRFRDESGAQIGAFRRGAIAAAILLALLLLLDGIYSSRIQVAFGNWPGPYFENVGLFANLPSVVTLAPAFITILLAVHAAIGWQKQQKSAVVPFKTRLQTFFDAPADGLMRFDFSWIVGLVARSTAWVFMLGGFIYLCFNPQTGIGGLRFYDAATSLIQIVVPISLFLHFSAWQSHPRRRATLKLGWRSIAGSLLGFFVLSSVLYALITFATLPLAFKYDRTFQNAMERGEIQIARGKLGI